MEVWKMTFSFIWVICRFQSWKVPGCNGSFFRGPPRIFGRSTTSKTSHGHRVSGFFISETGTRDRQTKQRNMQKIIIRPGWDGKSNAAVSWSFRTIPYLPFKSTQLKSVNQHPFRISCPLSSGTKLIQLVVTNKGFALNIVHVRNPAVDKQFFHVYPCATCTSYKIRWMTGFLPYEFIGNHHRCIHQAP